MSVVKSAIVTSLGTVSIPSSILPEPHVCPRHCRPGPAVLSTLAPTLPRIKFCSAVPVCTTTAIADYCFSNHVSVRVFLNRRDQDGRCFAVVLVYSNHVAPITWDQSSHVKITRRCVALSIDFDPFSRIGAVQRGLSRCLPMANLFPT